MTSGFAILEAAAADELKVAARTLLDARRRSANSSPTSLTRGRELSIDCTTQAREDLVSYIHKHVKTTTPILG